MDRLPDIVLDKVFACCDRRTLAVICTVCKHWQQIFNNSTVALPPLRLSSPFYNEWLRSHEKRLTQITLRRVEDLECAHWLRSLQSLTLEECRRLEDLSPLAHLANLSKLVITSCRSIRDLSPLMDLPHLHSLTIDRCFARDLSPLSGHPGLQELHLAYDCWSVMHLCLPDSLPVLQRMRIMSAIQDIGPLARFTGLQELEVYCVSVYDLSALGALTELQELDLHTLQESTFTLQEANGLHVGSLSPLSALSNLKALGLQGSDASIVDICPWHCLTGLTRVDLHGSCVSDLLPLRCLANLQALDLTEARDLVDLEPLSSLLNLSELVLTGCRKVRDLRPVQHLASLGGLKKP